MIVVVVVAAWGDRFAERLDLEDEVVEALEPFVGGSLVVLLLSLLECLLSESR